MTAVYGVIIATTAAVLNKTLYVYAADREGMLLRRVAKDSMIMAAGVVIYVLALAAGYTLIP